MLSHYCLNLVRGLELITVNYSDLFKNCKTPKRKDFYLKVLKALFGGFFRT